MRQPGLVKGGRAERAEENVGAEALERRAVRGREVEERLEEPEQPSPRAEEPPGLLDVEAGAEPLEESAVREERRDDRLGLRLDEQVELVRVRKREEGFEKVEDEHARAAVAAVRRQGREVDEDPRAPPL